MKSIDGVNLAMTDFGTIGFGTIEPGNSAQEEQISFTGITQNANGTATLTGVKTVMFLAPYTQTANLAKSHIGGSQFIISNTSGFYDRLTGKANDETVTGKWTFPGGGNASAPVSGTVYAEPTNDLEYASKKYIDDIAIAGSPKASEAVYGIAKLSLAASSATNPIIVGDNDPRLAKYAEDAEANDTYVITLSPVPSAYYIGMIISFKANTINTGAATLNVNGLGAKTIVKEKDTTLANGDIKAGQWVSVVYDGTNFQMVSPVGVAPSTFGSKYAVASDTSQYTSAAEISGVGNSGSKTFTLRIPGAIKVVVDAKQYTDTTGSPVVTLIASSPLGNTPIVIQTGVADTNYHTYSLASSGFLPTGVYSVQMTSSNSRTDYIKNLVVSFTPTNIDTIYIV